MNNETVLGLSRSDKSILIIIPPILGALLGWFMPTIAGWLVKVPLIPFKGPLEWIATLEGNWLSIIAMIVGVIAGIIFTLYVFHESLKITISDSEVKLEIKEKDETIEKKDIFAIFMEGKYLTFLGVDGVELYREQSDEKTELVEDAFKYHGYSWAGADPFENQYQRWIADYPDLPSHVNALLSAREHALKNDEDEEAQILRKDLAKLGVVIRDKDKRQYVRIIRSNDK